MLEGEVDCGYLGIDAVEGVEAVVSFLVPLHRDGVALKGEGDWATTCSLASGLPNTMIPMP